MLLGHTLRCEGGSVSITFLAAKFAFARASRYFSIYVFREPIVEWSELICELDLSSNSTPMLQSSDEPQTPEITWSVPGRVVASLLVAFHVFAVFVAPWSSPPPASALSEACANAMYPYLKAVAIDNGYRFFAPDPGPSNLVRYEIEYADGRTESWEFPDPSRHWPRLYYHRQFMLSETLAGMYSEAESIPPLETLSAEDRKLAEAQLAGGELLKRSVARYLLLQHDGAQRIKMHLRRHLIPTPADIQGGMQIDDERLYEETTLAEYTREML